MQNQAVIDRIASRIPWPPDPLRRAALDKLPEGVALSTIPTLFALSGIPSYLPNTVFRKFKRIHRQMLLPSPICTLSSAIKIE